MDAVRTLFSFRGEIGRGQFWLINIGIGIVSMAVMFLCLVASAYSGETSIVIDDGPGWPHTFAGGLIFTFYWLFEIAFLWTFLAAMVKRLRDVGIALKWLLVFSLLFALYGLAIDQFLHEGSTTISPLGWIALLFTGLPACGMGVWILGSVFFVSGYKSQRIDPAQLPEGWKR